MEAIINDFQNENIFEDQYLNSALQTNNFPEGDDEDESDEDEADDNPPLDETVVHSPVTTQNGGKP